MNIEFWRVIQRRLHEESALHYPRNQVRLILKAYVDGILNKYKDDSRIFFEQGFLLTAIGSYLDERGNEMGVARKNGTYAKGTVTFSLQREAVSRLSIPKGTVVVNENTGYEYVTTHESSIEIEETETTVGIQGIIRGKKYNCSIEEITIINSSGISSDLTVTNHAAITGGSDGETDEEYRKRLFNEVSTNLSVNYLKRKDIILYAKDKYDDNVRLKMTSLNPYMNDIYCAIPPNYEIRQFLLKDVLYKDILDIYIKGW